MTNILKNPIQTPAITILKKNLIRISVPIRY